MRERTHIRDCTPDDLGGPVPLVVVDLSFISLSSVLDALLGLLADGGRIVALVKPQFEAGRADADRGRGVIRDPAVWRRVLGRVAVRRGGPRRGHDGVDDLAHHRRTGQRRVLRAHRAAAPRPSPSIDDDAIDAVVDEARQREQPR